MNVKLKSRVYLNLVDEFDEVEVCYWHIDDHETLCVAELVMRTMKKDDDYHFVLEYGNGDRDNRKISYQEQLRAELTDYWEEEC